MSKDNAPEVQELKNTARRLRNLAKKLEAEADRLEDLAQPAGETMTGPEFAAALLDLDTSKVPEADFSSVPLFEFPDAGRDGLGGDITK